MLHVCSDHLQQNAETDACCRCVDSNWSPDCLDCSSSAQASEVNGAAQSSLAYSLLYAHREELIPFATTMITLAMAHRHPAAGAARQNSLVSKKTLHVPPLTPVSHLPVLLSDTTIATQQRLCLVLQTQPLPRVKRGHVRHPLLHQRRIARISTSCATSR
jgi:hypothetical protein